ncbi:MAG: glycosyltransferase family 1 protein [Thermomicrobiales bacterium]|nr:MAG: glycosyltransferase family 1 protein [Thermomicrobiales bacterium]
MKPIVSQAIDACSTLNRESSRVASGDKSSDEQAVRLTAVAICTVGELFGGVERHVLGMLQGLRAAGIEARLVLFHDAELAAQARAQGDVPVILPGRNRSLFETAKRLARILAEHHVRLVHVHGYKAAVFCAIARLWHRFAIVKTEHGMPEPMAGGALSTLRDRTYHRLDTFAMRKTNAAICYVSRDLWAFRQQDHAGLRTNVVSNGIGPMRCSDFPRPPEYSSGCLNAAIVGRLDRVKGHRFAIEALDGDRRLRTIHLQVIGSGPTEAELRDLVRDRDMTSQVHFLGFRRNVYDYIAHCDVLLMPSLHEGLPYTLLEAMALGRPIVASSVGGLAEVLEHGKTALLVPAGDAPALASTLLRILEDPELRASLGANARTVQRERYSLESMTHSYLAIYREHLAAGRFQLFEGWTDM